MMSYQLVHDNSYVSKEKMVEIRHTKNRCGWLVNTVKTLAMLKMIGNQKKIRKRNSYYYYRSRRKGLKWLVFVAKVKRKKRNDRVEQHRLSRKIHTDVSNIYGILRFKRDPHPHQMEDDLFSMKGWSHQKQGSEYGGDVGVAYVTMTMTKLARSDKPIFDKQDRSVHLAAIARNRRKEFIHKLRE